MTKIKSMGERGVTLADASGMVEGGTPLSIEQCAGGGRAEQDGNPFAPTRPKLQSLKDFQKIAPINSVKCFVDVKLHE